MSSNSCPKTCNQLAVAIILISIGIVQLLAGIILLKSEYVFLLSGTDFVVAVSNVSIGSLLGIAASVWEKKKKVVSLKSTARQNVLAGLYIAALSMNATAAIIMILGDGHKLLTEKDKTATSGDAVFEILACAYVTSVCSPIVCLVISLVCLSGNRIQIYENMKKKNSIKKEDSYSWVFENHYDYQSKNFGQDYQNSPISDNVFLEKKPAKLSKAKLSKKTHIRDSSTPPTEPQSPQEMFTHKRNKLLQEITSPQSVFFADDYLQFPEFNYDSYIGTMIPRIKQTSIIKTRSAQTTQPRISDNSEHKMTKTMSCKPPKPHLEELNLKLASRRLSYPDSGNTVADNTEKLNVSPEMALELSKSIDETDVQTSNHSMLHRTHAIPLEHIETKRKRPRQRECFDFEGTDSSGLIPESCDVVDNRRSSDVIHIIAEDTHNLRLNSNDSGSSGLTAETISELKAKINKMNFDRDENRESKFEFLRSFKRKSSLPESDVKDEGSAFQKLHEQYSVFPQISESDSKTALAGEVVPIPIKPNPINRANSIPLQTICPKAPSRYSVNEENTASGQRHYSDSDCKKPFFTTEKSHFHQRSRSFSSSYKDISSNQPNTEFNSFIKHPDKSDFKKRMSHMGSIEECPTEEFLQCIQSRPTSETTDLSLFNVSSEESSSVKNTIRHYRKCTSLKRLSSKATPNLLNRLWSMKRGDTNRADLTNLIMDADSLVGLSDDQLMDRTSRIRQLRKTVELRSKTEQHNVGSLIS